MKGTSFFVNNCTFTNKKLVDTVSKKKLDSIYDKFEPSLRAKLLETVDKSFKSHTDYSFDKLKPNRYDL